MKIADSKNLTATAASLVAVFALGAAGCSDRTQEAASNAAQSAGQDVKDTTAAAGQAVENADRATTAAVQNAGQEIKEEVREADEAVGGAAKKVGAEIKEETAEAKEAIGGAVAGAAQGVKNAGQVVALTPGVKNALVGNDQLDATNINVETDGEKNVVMLKGSVKSQKEKDLATKVAQQYLKGQNSTFKLQNSLTVGGAAASR